MSQKPVYHCPKCDCYLWSVRQDESWQCDSCGWRGATTNSEAHTGLSYERHAGAMQERARIVFYLRRRAETHFRRGEEGQGILTRLANILESGEHLPCPPVLEDARRPPPPDQLVGALQDRVHSEDGRLITATPIRVPKEK